MHHTPQFLKDYQEQQRKQAEEGRKMGIQKSALDWSDEVVPEFTTNEVEKLVKGLKDNRAPGYDHISPRLVKNGGRNLIVVLTDIFNSIIKEGLVPESLNQGIMNLIPKEKSALTLKQRRPLTISSIIVGMFTSRTAKLLSKVAEREDHLSDSSFGFREGRSTTDCIFLLNTIIQKAKKKKIPLF